MAQEDSSDSPVLGWEEELVQAVIGMNEHTAHAIDIINGQLKLTREKNRLEDNDEVLENE